MNMQTGTSVQELTLPLKADKANWLKSKIRDIPDFPKPGIIFKDLTPLLKDAEAFAFAVDVMTERCRALNPHYIAGIEARGFILAPTIAYKLGIGFVPIRKPGKLPYTVQKLEYALEYGTDCIEIHSDSVEQDNRIVLIDDLLATGGTAGAAAKLLAMLGGHVVGVGFLVELGFLNGRKKLESQADVFAVLDY
jgi:adenine phosphoribosyltransferase